MRVTKLYCDCCNKEIQSVQELYDYPVLNTMKRMNDGSVEIRDKEICEDCLYTLSEAFNKFKYDIKKGK